MVCQSEDLLCQLPQQIVNGLMHCDEIIEAEKLLVDKGYDTHKVIDAVVLPYSDAGLYCNR